MATYTSKDLPPDPINGLDDDIITIEVISGYLVVDLTDYGFINWDSDVNAVLIDGSARTESLDLTGSSENDIIYGGSGDDVLAGGPGDDRIVGGEGADTIYGGDGDDTIVGFTTGDMVDGGAGDNTLELTGSFGPVADEDLENVQTITAEFYVSEGEAGVTIDLTNQTESFDVIGSAYDDTFISFTEGSTLDGGDGDDTLELTGSFGPVADDDLRNVETITAEFYVSEGDTGVTIDLTGQSEAFTVVGSAYDDTFISFTEGSTLDGGDGDDTLELTGSFGPVADDDLRNVETITAEFYDSEGDTGVTIDLTGQSEAFTVVGSAYDDTFVSFTEGSTLDGGAGDDVLRLTGSFGPVDDDALVSVETITAELYVSEDDTGVEIDLTNQTEGFRIIGSGYADTITGGAGDDTIVGFTAGDVVDGGAGADTLELTGSFGPVADDDLKNVETVSAATFFTKGGVGVTIDLSGQLEGFNIIGSDYADTITGGDGDDDIKAGGGNDTIIGFLGSDRIDGGAGFDTLALLATSDDLNAAADGDLINVERVSASAAIAEVVIDLGLQSDGFEIVGSAHGDIITGSSGADVIMAGAGDDTIIGFVGADSIDGGAGLNTLVLAATSASLNAAADGDLVNVQVVTAALAAGPVTIDLSRQSDGFAISGGSFGDIIVGSSGADDIMAGDGDDIIVGFVGADRIDGGGGNDTLTLAATSTSLNAAADADLVSVETVTAAGAAAGVLIDLSRQTDGFAITGSAHGDTLVGSSGADRMDGGAGADTLTGGAGFDVVRGGDGDDIIRATVGDGNDVYDGGAGIDTVDYSATSGGVKVDLTPMDRSGESVSGAPGSVAAMMAAAGLAASTPVGLATGGQTATDVLISIENVVGSSGNDTVLGNSAANVIYGGGGHDKIWGRGGDDTIYGGAGNDVLVGDFGGSGAGDDQLYGGAGNDELYGEGGNDILDGGRGSDLYSGGKGRDLLIFDKDGASDIAWGGPGRDTFKFEKGFGKDRIKDFLATGNKSDKIDLTSFKGLKFKDLKIKQKGSDVEIKAKKFGKDSKIILEVVNKGAVDKKDFIFDKKSKKLKGDAASDKPIVGGKGNDEIKGTGGNDIIKGKRGDDTLIGRAGDDTLIGGKGNDTLVGGKGNDFLVGGPGRDTFVFKSPGHGVDTIGDFTSGTDTLSISAKGFGGGLKVGETVRLVGFNDVVETGKGVFRLSDSGSDAGTVYWDAKGGSSDGSVAIMRIGASSSLLDTDFKIA